MKNHDEYVIQSLDLHLFFVRIMKEHSLFLEAGFTPANANYAKKAEFFKNEFEKLLMQAVSLSDGIVCEDVLRSGAIVTEFTLKAEQQTQRLTGIQINEQITRREAALHPGKMPCVTPGLVESVNQLNQASLALLNSLILFKETILNNVLSCQMFTGNYPLLLDHILREAKLYQSCILKLESGDNSGCQRPGEMEQFWNQIMMEHALFIRGLLDPSENELIQTSDEFADEYARLLAASREVSERALSLEETIKFRDFKAAGAEGIQNCQIRSIILPLLADHVLREANHYIQLLESRFISPFPIR